MALLKFDDVVAKRDLPHRDVVVPEWGGSIRVRHWTVAERNEFARKCASETDRDGVGAWLVSALTIDEEGNPWCPAERFLELQKKNTKAIDAIVSAILEINKIDDKAVDDAEKK